MREIPNIANINLLENNYFSTKQLKKGNYQIKRITMSTLNIPETDSKRAMTTTLRLTL